MQSILHLKIANTFLQEMLNVLHKGNNRLGYLRLSCHIYHHTIFFRFYDHMRNVINLNIFKSTIYVKKIVIYETIADLR
ncbi:hypothetical protein C5167_020889 [Papaver somniferum]|uniref:Uncharacterized protein n=1 Tax=Papaver somniferum TaxID=3469 RepID=A0A4Y7IYG7_PAPSO|nr:hypothetical protein C5167_020889 [Papaver somniferum]